MCKACFLIKQKHQILHHLYLHLHWKAFKSLLVPSVCWILWRWNRDGRVWDGEEGLSTQEMSLGCRTSHTDNISTINPRPAGGQHNRLNQNQATDLELHVSCFWALPEEYMLMMQDSVSPCRHRSQWRHANMPSAPNTVGPIVRRLGNRPWSLVMTG